MSVEQRLAKIEANQKAIIGWIQKNADYWAFQNQID